MITPTTTIAELEEILQHNSGRLRSLTLEPDPIPANTRAVAVYRIHDGCTSASSYVDKGDLAAAISAALAKAGAR